MAKMRVYDLAKELGIESKQIIETLNTTEYAVKAASSNIDDPAQDIVRKKFGKSAAAENTAKAQNKENVSESKPAENKTAAPENKPAQKPQANEQNKPAEGAKTENAEQRPKKKSSITAVFNAQYSKQSRKPANGNNNNRGNGNGNGNNRRREDNKRPAQHSIIRPRPVGERAMRPISERTPSPTADLEVSKPANNKPAENTNTRNSQENRGNNNHSGGERNNRPQNDRNNDRGGERNNNRHQGDRNNNNRPNGDRNNSRPQNDRNNNGRKNRFSKEPAAVAAPEEIRGKDSRGNNDRRNNNNNHRKDHDKLGGKKQENYVNLEKHGGRKKPQQQPKPKEDENVIKTITLPEKMTIRDLADKMKLQPSAIVKKLFMKGEMVTVNQEVDFETAEEIALEFNFICEPEEKIDVIAELLKEDEEDPKNLVPRPPVVCVMGHVDHGKTSLLDAIRSTRVTDREAGGITQHIGASVVSINGQKITFLDTPGHEAFTAMRMRGANSTDIAILVVAADDGVMPQTIEAINHAKAAGVEIIVAVNKIDKPSANIEKVKQELSEYELIPEDWGGSTIFCPVSAHTKEGIDNLLEMILLTAEVMELKANPNRNARGLVIEAQLDKGRGAVATVLVQKGTLHVGDSIACGSSYGKVRAMIDDKGQRVKKATPSTPVEILGLNSVPAAGETFVVCDSDKEAKSFADTYISEEKNRLIEDTKAKMSLDDLFSQIQSGNMKELDIIVKADVQGSVEAVKQSLVKLSNEEVVVKVIHGGVGAINESDVILASASNAIIIGFNVRPDPIAKVTADNEGVDIRLYKVIYNAIEDVEAAMKGMLDPVFEEKVIGHAEIRQIFKASGVGNIAGSYVLDGVMERGCKVRISREGEQIFEGDLGSLKRFKDDVKEVKAGFECGLVFDGFNDIQELDQVEAYKMVEVPR
jgi:translation initiation factor IF-2